jgi:hypothetical protein
LINICLQQWYIINKYEKYLGEETQNKELTSLDETIDKNTNVINTKTEKICLINEELRSIQESVAFLLKQFQDSKFKTEIITNVYNIDDVEFNGENIGQYLMNVED